jgi:GAF domain-containing protein
MDHVVRLISEKFNFYHSGIYLVDDTRNYAVLRAASSEGGKRMLERGHKLAIGQVGIVGHVAGQGEPRIALDVGSDAVYFDNPDLPQTRSELALPLKAREEIIGVLDVQSTKASAFTEEDIEILQILSDQIAVAIENARLLSRSEGIIQELNSVYQTQVNQSWKSRLEPHPVAYAYRNGRVYKEPRPNPPGEQEGAEPNLLRLPVTLRNQPLGWITLRRSPQARAWSQEEVEFASSIVSQLALALENARLMEENRRRAQQEEMIGSVSAKTQGMLDVESVVKAALEEIGKSLGLSKVQIILGEQERIN